MSNEPEPQPTTTAPTDDRAAIRAGIGDIRYARRALTALALELPEIVHADVAATFTPLLDELETRRGPRTENGGAGFGEAITQLKLGNKVRRGGWPAGMYAYLVTDATHRARDGADRDGLRPVDPMVLLQRPGHERAVEPIAFTHFDVLASDWEFSPLA